jgi:branched-chain amino acid transport system substrate-binding protein
MKRPAVVLAATVACGLVLAACGGAGTDGGAKSAGQSSSTAGARDAASGLTGAPIVVADISDITGIPGFDPSPLSKGEKAAVDYVNSHGGIGGRPLRLTSCDSKLEPGASAACGQAAVADKAVAVVGIDNVATNGLDDIVRKAGIVSLQVPTAPQQFSDPNYFSLGAGGPAEYYGLGYHVAHTAGAKKVSMIVQDAAFGHTFADQVTAAAKGAGADTVDVTYYPPATTDFSSVAAKAASSHPDAVVTVINGSQIPIVYGLLQQQGVPADRIFNQSGALNTAVYKAAGQKTKSTYVNNEFANPNDTSNPDVKIYRQAMQDAGQSEVVDTFFAEWGFANIMFLAELGKTLGAEKMTAAGLKDYLSTTLAPGSTKTLPVFLASPMGPAPAKYPSLHRTSIQVLQWDGDRFKNTSGMFTAPELTP